MPRTRRYAIPATQQQHPMPPPIYLPALEALPTVPSKGRWKMAVDMAARLLQSVAEEMQEYSDERGEYWHRGDVAIRFHENLDQVSQLQALLDDLKAAF